LRIEKSGTHWSVAQVWSTSRWIETEFTSTVVDTVETSIQAVGVELKESISSGLVWILESFTTGFIETLRVGWRDKSVTDWSISVIWTSSSWVETELASAVVDAVQTTIQT